MDDIWWERSIQELLAKWDDVWAALGPEPLPGDLAPRLFALKDAMDEFQERWDRRRA